MKKIIILLACLWGIAQAQTPPSNYTDINAGYQWLRGAFKALTIPAYGDTALVTGQWRKAGAVLVDTTGSNKGVYVWYDNKWNVVGGGGIATNIYTADGILTGDRTLTGDNGTYGMIWDSMALVNFNVFGSPGDKAESNLTNSLASINYASDGLDRENKVIADPSSARLEAVDVSESKTNQLTVDKDSVRVLINGNPRANFADTSRFYGPVKIQDGRVLQKKSTASEFWRVQDENGRNAIQHSWNRSAKIYFQYLYDTLGAFHWNMFNEARTATWIIFGVKRYLTRVSDTAYFGLGNYPGDPSTYEPLQEGYMWMNDATANFRGYRNGLSRSFVMNNTGYGVDTVYLNGGGDSLVFEIFGRRYAFEKGSGGGGGSPGGSNTQVQYNNSGAFGGSSAFTYAAGVASLGVSGTLGGIDLLGSTSGTVSIRPKTTAGTWTMSLPNSAGSNRQFLQTDGTGALAWAHGLISDLQAAGAANTIDNTNFAQNWQWSTLAAGNGLNLTSTSTAAASNTQTLFNVALSGANSTSTQTTYAAKIANTHTGTSSTNYGLQVSASGGTNNYGAQISPTLIIGSPTLSANHGIVIQTPTNTATDGIRLYSNNLTSFIDYGWQKITKAGAIEINTTSGAINLTPSTGVYVGSSSTATALLQIAAGATSKAPMRFTSGLLATGGNILAGNVEFLTDKWYGTISTGPAVKEFTMNDAALTSGTVPVATTNGRLTDGLIITSGTYTPTFTNGTNITSTAVSGTWKYQRVGSVVTVSGALTITQTAGSSSTEVGISLPIASAFTLASDCNGSLSNEGSLSSGKVVGDATNDRASINWFPSGTSAVLHSVMFQYEIK